MCIRDSYHTCSHRENGTACWGRNNYGQLGDGTMVDKSIPVAVASLGVDVELLSLGSDHSCATKTDGSLWCWGFNSYGQVGNGTTTNQSVPVVVGGAPPIIDILALGGAHTCAKASDGGVWCWGLNTDGQVGDGTTVNRQTPVELAALGKTGVTVSPGWFHTCALKSDDTVWCWGDNEFGQLGTGTAIDSTTPVATVSLGPTVQEIISGGYHSCAIKAGGSVWCWGLNATGQLGDGTTENKTSPVEVTSLIEPAVGLAAGVDYTCAWTADDRLFCWGGNGFGQLGDGTTQDKTSPVEVNLCP